MNHEVTHQINLALRTAAGHARAAADVIKSAEGSYEMKMKSAGASVWEAWKLAVAAQPEFAGRKLDDKALTRIYESTRARPWWDRQLSAVKIDGKPATREWAMRTMQWHTDPDAARARRAKDKAVSAANYRKLKGKQAAHGRQRPQGAEPTTAEMRELAEVTAHPARAQAGPAADEPHGARWVADLLLLERCRRALNRPLNKEQIAEAAAILRLAAEGLEAI